MAHSTEGFRHRVRRGSPALGLASVLALASAAPAQDNPVYIDDSPLAWELFRQAQDQARRNAGEAVRLYQQLLDDFGDKLIPASEATAEDFAATRLRVLAAIRGDAALLERYRLLETAEAARLLAAGDLERLSRTRSLTAPGLEALLRLGQRELESADFHAAMAWLREAAAHPDLHGLLALHGWSMMGLAAHYLGDPRQLQGAMAALAGAGPQAEPFVQRLRELTSRPPPPPPIRGISSVDNSPQADLSDLVGEEIWSVDLPDSLFSRRAAERSGGEPLFNPALASQRRDIDLLTISPTIVGSTVLVNEGYSVRAINRFTGRDLWARPFTDFPVLPATERESESAVDLNLIAVHGDSVITYTGDAYAETRSAEAKVVCLDLHTGEARWSARVDRLSGDKDHEELFPHGMPVVAGNMVFVSARKVSRQSLASTYVFALDLADGSLRWSKHICSSGGLRTRVMRPFTNLLHDGGDLFVASAVGAIARLDAATGQTRWLRKHAVPIQERGDHRPWEVSAPILIERGLLTFQPDWERVVLLDRDTGEVLESHGMSSQGGWASPRYLLADQGLVFAVGETIRAFRASALDVPVWRLPAVAAPPDDLDIAGRVQAVGGSLVVPTMTGVLIVDQESGHVTHRLPTRLPGLPGNPLAAEAQLMVAGPSRMDAYMSFSRAEGMLRSRLAASPGDAEPALSLLRLGMRVERTDLMLEAGELALAAVNTGNRSEAREELLTLLIEAAVRGGGSTGPFARGSAAEVMERGEALHALIAGVAREPHQRVEHLLAYGDWLAGPLPPGAGSVTRAAEAYQGILSEPALAVSLREEGATIRPAAAWARQRLERLIEQRGSAVYAAQSAFAASKLQRILASMPVDVAALRALAQEFPFSNAAIDATIAGAEQRLRGGDARGAVAILLAGYRLDPRAEVATRLLGEAVRIGEGADGARPAEAGAAPLRRQTAAILRHVLRVHGDIPLAVGAAGAEASERSAMRSAGEVFAALTGTPLHPPLPRIGEFRGDAELLNARLVPLHPQAMVSRADAALMLARNEATGENELRLVAGGRGQPLWSAPVETGIVQLLRLDDRDVLLWLDGAGDNPWALMLDAATGRQRWATPRLATIFADPIRVLQEAAGAQELMPDGSPIRPGEVLPLVGSERLVAVKRNGQVAAFRLSDGAGPVWTRSSTLHRVHLAEMHEFGLVLAGVAPQADAGSRVAAVPAMLVLDPGEPACPIVHQFRPAGDSGVIWMRTTPLGLLTCAADRGLETYDLLSGQRQWATTDYVMRDSRRAWPLEDRLIVEDRARTIRALRLEDGAALGAFEAPLQGQWDVLDLQDLHLTHDRLFARYQQRIVRYDPGGRVIGADAVMDDREYKDLLAADDRIIVVSRHRTAQAVGGEHAGRTHHVYRVYAMSDNGRLIGREIELPPTRQRLQQAALIDGWLLLSTQTETMAIPLPLETAVVP